MYPFAAGMVFLKFLKKYFLFQNIFLFLNCFDLLILKINFINKKNIILIYFKIKTTLENNPYPFSIRHLIIELTNKFS
jgi:hypothetical protein